MKVVKIDKKTCEKWTKKKHYSRKLGIFWEGFALVEDGYITGVVCYGQPSAMIQKHAFNERDFRLYELTRVVIQSKTKNAGSFLIGNSLKMLKVNPCAVVSYADSNMNHCGILYQSTNWFYTGSPKACGKNVIIDGKIFHPSTLNDMGIKNQHKWAKQNGYELIEQKPKHRYFQFVGNKRDKKEMMQKLNYNILENYPKCDKKLYDDGENIEDKLQIDVIRDQLELF